MFTLDVFLSCNTLWLFHSGFEGQLSESTGLARPNCCLCLCLLSINRGSQEHQEYSFIRQAKYSSCRYMLRNGQVLLLLPSSMVKLHLLGQMLGTPFCQLLQVVYS